MRNTLYYLQISGALLDAKTSLINDLEKETDIIHAETNANGLVERSYVSGDIR